MSQMVIIALCCAAMHVLQVKYQLLAAASFLAEVVKALERTTSQAATTASAEPDEDMVSSVGIGSAVPLTYSSCTGL